MLASTLHDQRLGALEAGALLRTVMVEIDVAVFTFDGAHALRLVNRAGERLLGQPRGATAGAHRRRARPARAASTGQSPRIEDVRFPGGIGTMGSAADDVPPGRTAASARSCSPTSAGRCATKSARRGSG